ncbi:MAG: hypothetical protein KGL46_08085 [Hyphomicrobiales bacterium]|nr:hypothetical protein [Hyphomicrobiales bacterium]
MAEIIAFKPRANDERRHIAPSDGAEILFFTGVRYERLNEGAEPRKPKRRAKGAPRRPRARRHA